MIKEKVREIYKKNIPFMEGFLTFFDKINDHFKLPFALATSCDERDYNLIDKRLGITNLFKGHVYRIDMVVNSKPFPDIFYMLLNKLEQPLLSV